MLSMLVHQVAAVLRDKRGIETLEWILIGALIVGVGIAIYPGVLQPALTGVVGDVAGAIQAQVP